MENLNIKVENVTPDGGAVTRIYNYEIDGFARLGKEVRVSPKSHISINKPGFKTEFFVETVSVVIGIGNDHSADLIMSKSAWEALNSGEEVSVITTEEFKKKYIYKKKDVQ